MEKGGKMTATYVVPAVLSLAYVWFGLGLDDLTALLMALSSALVVLLCVAANFSTIGHGVDGRIHIAKVPLVPFAVHLIVFILGMIPLCLPVSVHGSLVYPSLFLNGLGMSFILGGAAGLCNWYFYAYYATYYYEEGLVRAYLAYRGKTLAEVDMRVRIIRERGLFGPE